jgi:hypothetical protein
MGLVPNERWFFAGSHKVPGTLLLLARSYCSVFAPPFSARNLVPGTNFSAASEGAWHQCLGARTRWSQSIPPPRTLRQGSSDLPATNDCCTFLHAVTIGLVPKGTMIFAGSRKVPGILVGHPLVGGGFESLRLGA